MKAGILNEKALSKEEIAALGKASRARSAAWSAARPVSQPATGFVRVINAVPQGLVNVLQAKVARKTAKTAKSPQATT